MEVTPKSSSPTSNRCTPRPDGFDHASEIMAQAARKPEPGKRLHLAPANFPVHRVGCCSPDLNANLALPRVGWRHLVQPQFLRGAIVEILNAPHERAPLARSWLTWPSSGCIFEARGVIDCQLARSNRTALIGTIATLIVALASRI